ncbi:hypothetical protein DID88_009356 [Monilinia fructigena]|uniref:SMP-30/Gluconolactonase/LRE-like region domain-containing protein n=1 Tax=Monilinia fructigena TaxID=38457 RepID=A0A395IMU4_9HELO|nr:hypothetical protein DID88_009356 [Monilinia fructigena]
MVFATGALAQETVYTFTPDKISALNLYNSQLFFVTSNQYASKSNSSATNNKTISITRLDKTNDGWTSTIIESKGAITLANGGAKIQRWPSNLRSRIYDNTRRTILYEFHRSIYTTRPLINHYYGVEFNSPNDVYATSDGPYGSPIHHTVHGKESDHNPQLPNHVYRYMPDTNDIRVVADGFQEPNGITFSPDEKTAYITDGMGNSTNPTGPRAIYAYDVITRGGQPSLANKRIFAVPQKGLPDGIKTDAAGNVYAGCGDGVNVWNEGGILIGKVVVPGGSANFVLGNEGNRTQIWLLNEDKLWQASLGLYEAVDGTNSTSTETQS